MIRRVAFAVSVAMALASCGSGDQPAVLDQGPEIPASTIADSTEIATEQPSPALAVDAGPDYEVFLAAVADTLDGTRFEELPFDEAELFAATGLVLCEQLEEGAVSGDVVFDYLTQLTSGNAASADDDQLVLAGALMGAAGEALCPDSGGR